MTTSVRPLNLLAFAMTSGFSIESELYKYGYNFKNMTTLGLEKTFRFTKTYVVLYFPHCEISIKRNNANCLISTCHLNVIQKKEIRVNLLVSLKKKEIGMKRQIINISKNIYVCHLNAIQEKKG